MQLIVGLGNPGPKYERTRHNLGFRVLDELAARYALTFGPVHDGCRVAEGRVDGVDFLLIKPCLYMNRSGDALINWAGRRGLELHAAADAEVEARQSAPLVVCDDIALPLGALRLRGRGSDGGHRGLESMAAALGHQDYPRMRLGVGGEDGEIPAEIWADYVLEAFDQQDWDLSEDLVDYAAGAVDLWLREGLEAAKSRFNRRKPEEPVE
jgi:peptidyl-tRNA hydrolase, PTH1 family